MVGSWNINITVGAFPQKVASALADLKLVGAEYTPIAYIGSQLVNGTNHAVLAKQTLVTGKDTTNIVMLILNERDDKVTLAAVDRIIEQGGKLGGIQVAQDPAIPEEARQAFATAFEGYVGINVELIAYLGSQMTKGLNHIFLVKTTDIRNDADADAAVVVANDLTKRILFTYVLTDRTNVGALGYAFTWLMKQNVALGSPLGEWPYN